MPASEANGSDPSGAILAKIANNTFQSGSVGGNIETVLQQLLTELTAINTNTDGLEVKADTLNLQTDQLEAPLAAIQAAVELLDNAVSGSELQVDIVSSAIPSGAATESTLSGVATQATMASVLTELQTLNTGISNLNTAIGTTADAAAPGTSTVIGLLKAIDADNP